MLSGSELTVNAPNLSSGNGESKSFGKALSFSAQLDESKLPF